MRAGMQATSADQAEVVPERLPRPEDERTSGLWTTRTAILTPGDKFSYKLKVEKGETILAGASSDAFDPALAIEDGHKKILAQNDDRVDGDQSPFIAYRFKEAGEYNLKVLSYRSVSGGKFTLKLRTFCATDISIGSASHTDIHPADTLNRVVFRLTAQKDKIYDLRSVSQENILPGGQKVQYTTNFLSLVGPTGVPLSDFRMIDTPDAMPVFQALSDGDFYAEYNFIPTNDKKLAPGFHTDVREVSTVKVKATDDQAIPFEGQELKLVEMSVKADQIVRTTLQGEPFNVRITNPDGTQTPNGPGTREPSEGQPYGNSGAWSWFKTNIDSDTDVTRVFHSDDKIRFAVRCLSTDSRKLVFKNVESLPEWKDSVPLANSLNIGDSQLFVLKSTKSELMRVAAQASHFLPRLDILRLSGELANSLCDRRTHIATDDLYFPEEGTFVIRLSCEGNGGSGDFEMKRESAKPIPYLLGATQTMQLDGKNFGLYSVDLQAGKRYQLVLDQPNSYVQVDLMDDDGQFLTSQNLAFDKVRVHYFVPTRSGRHRIWLRGSQGTWHFQFDLHNPPSLGGG